LAWATTIHSFEGQNAGPTPMGQLDNAVMRIIVHLCGKKEEKNSPGLAYTTLTRTTTLGSVGRNDTIPMEYLDSSFYFVAETFPSGIVQLTHKGKGDEYEKVNLRRRWVDYLQRRKTMTSQIIKVEDAEVKQWMTSSIYNVDNVLALIHGASSNSSPEIDHRHQLDLHSAQEDYLIDIIAVDNLQLPSIIPNYSYILIQGKYLVPRDIMAYL
jgi:hypothetical protein